MVAMMCAMLLLERHLASLVGYTRIYCNIL